jgi:hypothetical protein
MEEAMNTTNQNRSNHEADSAAIAIQRCYRRHSATRESSLTLIPGDFGSVAVAATKTKEHQDDEHEDKDLTKHPGGEKERKRSHLWGVAAVAGTFVGMVGLALVSGPPVDEDDAIAVAAIFQGKGAGAIAGGGTGGGTGAGGTGAGAGVGASASGGAGAGGGTAAGGGAGGGTTVGGFAGGGATMSPQ